MPKKFPKLLLLKFHKALLREFPKKLSEEFLNKAWQIPKKGETVERISEEITEKHYKEFLKKKLETNFEQMLLRFPHKWNGVYQTKLYEYSVAFWNNDVGNHVIDFS